jgi:N,N'-diacetyllegionaminate synthase
MILKNLIKKSGLVIAEIACGHNGSIDNFIKIIDELKKTNCRIIKSQIFITSERTSQDHSEWSIFKKLTLSPEQWFQIVKYAKKRGFFFFSDIFGSAGLNIAKNAGIDGYKIHTETLSDYSFIEKVLKTKKITLVGVGGSYRSEIFNFLNFFKKKNLTRNIVLMPGIQNFPTKLKSHSLYEIKDLVIKYKKRFDVSVGCADHISGNLVEAIEYPMLALASGAEIIEKHFTIDRKLQWEDYESALDFRKFSLFVNKIDKYFELLEPKNDLTDDEIVYRNRFKKIPIFNKNLNKNYQIKTKDISYIKSDKEKDTISIDLLKNKITKNKVFKNDQVRLSSLKQKIAAIIVVRNNSTRLKNKALKKINGEYTIVLLIKRIQRCKNIDQIILATTKDKSDDIFVRIAEKLKIKIFRGDADNVAKRFYKAAKKFRIDQIVRITGDDILRDEKMIDKAIISHLHRSSDVTITTNMPYGTQTEIFSIKTIKLILENVLVPPNTEYLEWFLQNTKNFKVNLVKSDYVFNNKIRLTLDYNEDFVFFKKIFSHFKDKYFSLLDIINLINEKPFLLEINSHKTTKIKTFKNINNLLTSSAIDLRLNI